MRCRIRQRDRRPPPSGKADEQAQPRPSRCRPLYWTIDSRQKLVAIACEGDVTLADLVEYLDVVEGASALAYRKLFDGTAFQTSMTESDILEIGARFQIGRA